MKEKKKEKKNSKRDRPFNIISKICQYGRRKETSWLSNILNFVDFMMILKFRGTKWKISLSINSIFW